MNLDAWPREVYRAVGYTQRDNDRLRISEPAASNRLRRAYLAAGGDPAHAASAPLQIIGALSAGYPDWLWGPFHRRRATERAYWKAKRQAEPLGNFGLPPISDMEAFLRSTGHSLKDEPRPIQEMCTRYSQTSNADAICKVTKVRTNLTGNLAPQRAVFPDYPAPIARNCPCPRPSICRSGRNPPQRGTPARSAAPVSSIAARRSIASSAAMCADCAWRVTRWTARPSGGRGLSLTSWISGSIISGCRRGSRQ